jgi:hypothetical protein
MVKKSNALLRFSHYEVSYKKYGDSGAKKVVQNRERLIMQKRTIKYKS